MSTITHCICNYNLIIQYGYCLCGYKMTVNHLITNPPLEYSQELIIHHITTISCEDEPVILLTE